MKAFVRSGTWNFFIYVFESFNNNLKIKFKSFISVFHIWINVQNIFIYYFLCIFAFKLKGFKDID